MAQAQHPPSFDPRNVLLALGTFAIGTDVFVIAGILKQIAADLSVSVEAAGQISSTIYIGSALGAASGGLLLAHGSRSLPPYAASAAVLLGLLLFLLGNRRRDRLD